MDECCVTCGGIGACGCKVEASCGYCCVKPCKCETQPAPPPGGLVLGRVREQTFAAYASGRRCPSVPDDERIFTPKAEQPAIIISSR